MNPALRLHAVLLRIASATSVIRTRSDDAEREARTGNGILVERLDATVTKLEKVAAELEAQIA